MSHVSTFRNILFFVRIWSLSLLKNTPARPTLRQLREHAILWCARNKEIDCSSVNYFPNLTDMKGGSFFDPGCMTLPGLQRRFVMKKIILSSILFAALAISPAFADEGFSAGASIGYSKISIGDSDFSVDFNGFGYKVFGTYMFNNNFGVEGSWLDFGNLSENIAGLGEAEVDADGFDLFLVGAYPVSDEADLFGKIGFVSWDAKSKLDGVVEGSDSGTDLALGFGGRFKTSNNFVLRAEYEWFDIEDTDSAWLLSVGFEYSFK